MKQLCPRWRKSVPAERKVAHAALEQLDDEWLEVILIPAPRPQHRGHMIRVAVRHNPDWYRYMVSARRNPGRLRQRTVRALQRLVGGWFDPLGLETEILMELGDDNGK